MKKIAACDIERKIRLIGELPDRYKTLSPEEKIWVPGLLSVAEAEIKDLLKKDRKAHLPALKLHKSRDVSHLKDLKSAKSSPAFISLPTDINQLKNLKDFQSVTKIKSNPKICKKKDCLQRVFSLSPEFQNTELLDYIDPGVPSGRKDVQNLLS